MLTGTGAFQVNEQIRGVSAIKPPRDQRPARARHARGRATWRAIEQHGDDLIRLGQIAKETRSVITKMVLLEEITKLEGEAAKRYAYVIARFEKYCIGTRRTAKSPSFERAFGTDQELERRQTEGTIGDYEAAAKKAKREYNKLMDAIAPYGSQAKSLLDDMCCSDVEPPASYRANLAVILRMIAKKFGVTERPKPKRKVSR